MFSTYQEIFTQRADSYHQAMADLPCARNEEFFWASKLLDVKSDHVVADMPAGGGYLRDHIQADNIKYLFMETSKEFAKRCPHTANCQTVLCDFDDLTIGDESVDRLVCLAALHHVENKQQAFREFYRVLKNKAKIVIADVESGSLTGDFLNIFVNRNNSMGHDGAFLTDRDLNLLTRENFSKINISRPDLFWHFDSMAALIHFFKNLFGLDKARDGDIIDAAKQFLALTKTPGRVSVKWELAYIAAEK